MTHQRLTIRRGSVAPYEVVNEHGDVMESGTYAYCREERFWMRECYRLDDRWIQGPPITIIFVHEQA
jgi:hypothetical protein